MIKKHGKKFLHDANIEYSIHNDMTVYNILGILLHKTNAATYPI